jgi:hypothetical protein
MLDHSDAVGARRDRRSGHDLNRFSGAQSAAGPGLTGSEQARDPQSAANQFCGSAGKAITGGTRERRLIAIRGDRLREDPSCRRQQRHGLLRARPRPNPFALATHHKRGFFITQDRRRRSGIHEGGGLSQNERAPSPDLRNAALLQDVLPALMLPF